MAGLPDYYNRVPASIEQVAGLLQPDFRLSDRISGVDQPAARYPGPDQVTKLDKKQSTLF